MGNFNIYGDYDNKDGFVKLFYGIKINQNNIQNLINNLKIYCKNTDIINIPVDEFISTYIIKEIHRDIPNRDIFYKLYRDSYYFGISEYYFDDNYDSGNIDERFYHMSKDFEKSWVLDSLNGDIVKCIIPDRE